MAGGAGATFGVTSALHRIFLRAIPAAQAGKTMASSG